MDCAEQLLTALDIEVHVPAVGELVVSNSQRVVRTAPTTNPRHVDKIAGVLAPGFTWIDDQGNLRVEAAEVVAYVAAPEPEGRDRHKTAGRTIPQRGRSEA